MHCYATKINIDILFLFVDFFPSILQITKYDV